MRFKHKITISLILFLISIFSLVTVSARGQVYHSWIRKNGGKFELVYRTFVTPSTTTLSNYHSKSSNSYVDNGAYKYTYGGKNYTSKWIDTSSVIGNTMPVNSPTKTYSTMGVAFHTSELGTYTSSSSGNVAYSNLGADTTSDISTVSTAYNNASSSGRVVLGNTAGGPFFGDKVFYTIWSVNGTYSAVNWGMGIKLTNPYAYSNTELRYSIVNFGQGNIYVEDNLINSSHIENLIKSARAATGNNNIKDIYVSDIVASKSQKDGYEAAYTAKNFFNSYNFGYSWSNSSRGLTSKALGSVVNLYDNHLKLPKLSTREVYVRHINIGNNTIINKKIVDSAPRIAKKYRDYKLFLNPGGELKGGNYINETYQEYFSGVPIESAFTKYAITPSDNTFRCIGCNVSTGNSLTAAQNGIDLKVNAGEYTRSSTVTVGAKSFNSDSDVTVIDFYYTEYEKDVYVNHIFVDKDNIVKSVEKQTIIPNETALEDGTTVINRVNTDRYIKETYRKRMGHFIRTKIADSLKDLISNNQVEYRGYKTYNKVVNVESIVGKKIVDYSPNDKVDISGDIVQVNYYYYYENQKEEQEPDKNIGGKVFVNKTDNDDLSTDCLDDKTTKSILSIPSGINATVGIKGIPRYMVAAIETKYEPANTAHDINLQLTYKFGNNTKTITFGGLKYYYGFFKVTDMALYKLNKMTIYDAENDKYDTIGSKLFDWNSKQLTPNAMNLGVELKGINNKTIKNNAKDISNLDNYIDITLKDNLVGAFKLKASEAEGSRVIVTVLNDNEIKKVDADGNKKIENADKTFAENKLNNLKSVLDNATKERENKQANVDAKEAIYNEKVNERNRLESVYNNAKTTLENKEQAKTNSHRQLEIYEESYDSFKRDYADGEEQKLAKLQLELEELEQNRTNKEQQRDEARQVLQNSETRKSELSSQIENLERERRNLKDLANCVDTVEEQVYIYMEDSEKEALEECRLNKEKYEENLEARELENAEEEYQEFLDNEYTDAVANVDNLEQDIQGIERDIEDKESEIRLQELRTNAARTMLLTLFNQKEEYRENVYQVLVNDYDSYEQNEYTTALNEYNEYVEAEYVEQALEELNASKEELEQAKENENKEKDAYDKYYSYKQTLDSLFDDYKKKYDDFVALNAGNENQAISQLGLRIGITVQNMIVNIKNKSNGTSTPLANASSNVAYGEWSLAEYKNLMNTNDVNKRPVVKTEKPTISKSVYSNIGSTLLLEKDFDNTNKIDTSIINGVRALAGEAEYSLERVIGDQTKPATDVIDKVYYSDKTKEGDDTVFIFRLKSNSLKKVYKVDTSETKVGDQYVVSENRYKETEPVNIYTPISVSANLTSNSSQLVDQSKIQTENDKLQVLQINTPFTVEFDNKNKVSGYKDVTDTSKYSDGYYIKFDFDVHKVKINGKTYKSGSRISAGTWIGIITKNIKGKAYIEAQAYGNTEDNKVDVISEEKSTYTVRGVAYNATSPMRRKSISYETLLLMVEDMREIANICTPNSYSYFAEESYDVYILNRLFDFRVTDVKDVNWKNVFRKSTKNKTNSHTNTVYYSGTTKWNTKSERANDIISRTTSEVGRNPLRILPIGPYKSSDITYIKSPKMGYRFSYDLKATGSFYNTNGEINTNKKINIETNFYYISKDGNTFLTEYDEKGEGIYLFYKKQDGTYVRIDQNGGNYALTFTPNDGYRLIDGINTTLSKKELTLGNLRKITLDHNMATVSNNSSYITYYGEYKLPNSTIAVRVKDGKYNINEPLSNGYIGVVFDISAYAGTLKNNNTVLLSYSKNTKEDPNTSQWDYEGFLGYTKYGEEVTENSGLSIKLENGTWKINSNDLYNKIKGTVMLYDIDSRAATDFD